jgi:hypothetical protein
MSPPSPRRLDTPREATLALSALAHARGPCSDTPLSLDEVNFIRRALLAGGQVGQGIKGSGVSVWMCLFAKNSNGWGAGWGAGRVRVSPHDIPDALPFLLSSFDDDIRPEMATRLFVEFFHRGSPAQRLEGQDPFGVLLESGAKPLAGLMDILAGTRYESRHHVEWFLNRLVVGKAELSDRARQVFDGSGLSDGQLQTARFFLEKAGRFRSDMTPFVCEALMTVLERDAMDARISSAGPAPAKKALRL